MNILLIIMFLIMPLVLSAQVQSQNYESPTNGVVSSGGGIQSQSYSASGTVLWYDPTMIFSFNYTHSGIGNVEILNGKSTTDVEENIQDIVENGIFPNPLNEKSLLRFTTLQIGTVSIEIFDYAGKSIYKDRISIQSVGRITVPLTRFYQQTEAGVFLLKLSMLSESKFLTVIKN